MIICPYIIKTIQNQSCNHFVFEILYISQFLANIDLAIIDLLARKTMKKPSYQGSFKDQND